MTICLDILWPQSILLADYPPIVKNWVFPLVVGLLSLSMPLVINNIQRVEEKFKKHATSEGVLNNCYVRWYKCSVIIVVIAVLVFLSQMPRIINCGPLNHLIDYSAEIILIIATVNLLASVIVLSFFFLKYTINTPAMYKYSKRNVDVYLKKASILTNPDDDTLIAEENQLSTLMAVIEKAFEEQNVVATNEIIADIRNAVAYYRKQRSTSERHLLIEYPLTFRNMLRDLVQAGIDTGEKGTQEQVKRLLHVIFFDDPAQYGDIPQYGLSYSTLQTIFRIIIDSIDRKHTEFVKIYWFEIFEYTRQMFYSQAVIAPNDCMPHNVERYSLTDDDKREQALISYMHFMVQAYLYENKEYDTLSYTLEYYNAFGTVQCLHFLSIDSALRAYCATGIKNDYFYYSNPNIANETDRRDYILANYMSFIANYNYNLYRDIPVSTANVVKMSLSKSRRLEEAFKAASTIPGIQINHIEVQKIMSQVEYIEFLKSLGERDEQDELTFLQKKSIRNFNTELLYKFIKDYLSYDILRHSFLWNILYDGIELSGIRKSKVRVKCMNTLAKDLMVYEDNQAELPNKGFEIAQCYLRVIDEKITLATYAKLSNNSPRVIDVDALHQIIQKLVVTDKMLFFYTQKEAPDDLATKMGYLYDNQRDYISPSVRNLYKCIKCVKLNGNNAKTKALENQIWILPYNQQPFVRFIEIANNHGWESIHQYGGIMFDKVDEWFRSMPHYIKIEEPIPQPEFPIAQLSLQCRMEIIEAKEMEPQIYLIDLDKTQ